jgi:bifunctional oligoribonuclease and PAP phosphatase NrnA
MSRILSPEQVAQAQTLTGQAKKIIVTSHKSPDGDAIGSALAMYHLLKKMERHVLVILPDEVPDFLKWVPGYEQILFFDQNEALCKDEFMHCDLIYALDYNHLNRVGEKMQQALENSPADFILIDHHQQPGSFPKVTYSDTAACSTCEMVYRFTEQCGWKDSVTQSMATCVYTGIMTDSGSFRFHTVSPDTHRIAAELMLLGIDHAQIHRDVYDVNLMDKLKLIGFALSEKLEVYDSFSTAMIWLTKEELKKYNHKQGDTEGLVNQALSIKGVKLAAFFREGNNEVKASFRSKGNFDVNIFARTHWNGGGHKNAAGGQSSDSIIETVSRFRELAEQYGAEITRS